MLASAKGARKVIWVRLSDDDVYYNVHHGFRYAKEWNRQRVECDKCGLILSADSLNKHLETQHGHGEFRSRLLNRDFLLEVLEDGDHETFTAHASMGGKFFCPVPGRQDSGCSM
mmetsp:Transcript_3033/g.4420  ORF Transcript_3033/g.4420 Transcript_3033/m.4420 type:complete len:114 (+) Transcript_3033:1588-1929(+)